MHVSSLITHTKLDQKHENSILVNANSICKQAYTFVVSMKYTIFCYQIITAEEIDYESDSKKKNSF